MVRKPLKTKKQQRALKADGAKDQSKHQRDHIKLIRTLFRDIGLKRLNNVSNIEFAFKGQATDIDDIFVYENLVVLAEYTTTASVGDHLRVKKVIFDKLLSSDLDTIQFLRSNFPKAADELAANYHPSKVIIKIVYCSRNQFDVSHKNNVPGPVYFDYHIAQYFAAVAHAIQRSSRFEFFNFLGVEAKRIGENGRISVDSSAQYHGSILPEAHSNFSEGFKVVSFYADPDSLLRRSYVLRRDGWRDTTGLYQRMVNASKISSI